MGLAKHIGDPKRDDSLTKENVKDLAQIMGVLSTEAAVAQLPKLDRAMAAWKSEKTPLKESMIQGVEPPSLKHELCSATPFWFSLWFGEQHYWILHVMYTAVFLAIIILYDYIIILYQNKQLEKPQHL